MMDNERLDKFRLPLAVLLSAAVFFTYYQYIALKNPPVDPKVDSNAVSNTAFSGENSTASPADPNKAVKNDFDNAAVKSIQQSKIGSQFPKIKEEFITLENRHLRLKLSTYNAAIAESILKDQGTASGFYDLESGSIINTRTGTIAFIPDFNRDPSVFPFAMSASSDNSVTFVGEILINGQTVAIEKIYLLKDYQLKLIVSLYSKSPYLLNTFYYIYNGSSLGVVKNVKTSSYFDITTLSYTEDSDNENALKPYFYSSEKDFSTTGGQIDWIAIDNRFYLRTLAPDRQGLSATFKKITTPEVINYISALKVPVTLGNTSIQDTYTYSFLPKNRSLLNKLSDSENGIPYYQIFRQFSWMKILSDFLYSFIVKIYEWVGNYGWAIIIMTLILKILIYPLTQKSYESMQKMQAMNPKLEEIRKKHKNDKQKAQREIMNLYRKEKINPAMGCFPMLIPIPIFFALYVIFQNMTELNNASFFWIESLAYPDKMAVLPFSLPFLGTNFNLLPILMSVSQFVQSVLTPQISNNEMAQAQAKMIKYFLPVFFLFICWNLPSALVLFWFIQNIFSIFQTLLTKRKTLLKQNK